MMAHEFGLVRRLLKEHSGLNLGEDKQDLLEGKLGPLLREFGCPTLSHLVLAVMKPDAHGCGPALLRPSRCKSPIFIGTRCRFIISSM